MPHVARENIQEFSTPQWDPTEDNLSFRIDQAIRLAKEHLYGYSDKDITYIWDIIKPELLLKGSKQPDDFSAYHPPIDRLFDIAFDINFYTTIYEGEVAPEAICSVYALKIAEHAQASKDKLSASLICIDAWRALAFIDRAKHLHKKLLKRLENKKKGEIGIASAQQKNQGVQNFLEALNKIRPAFNTLPQDIKYHKNIEPKEAADRIMKIMYPIVSWFSVNWRIAPFELDYVNGEIYHAKTT